MTRSCRLPATRSVTARWPAKTSTSSSMTWSRAAISSSASRQVGRFGVDRDEAEVAPGVVDADVEAAGAVLEVVLDVGAAREHRAQRERPVGADVGIGDLPLGRVLALAAEEEIALVERLGRRRCRTARRPPRRAARRRRRRTHDVAPEAVRALGLVHRHVVERAAVVRPRRRRHLRDRPRIDRAGREVLDVEREVAAAGQVGRVGEPRRVARDRGEAEAKERLAARQLVQVEQGLVDAARVVAPIRPDGAPAQVVRVLLAAPRLGRVPPVALSHRHRVVVLLDAREHLLVELLLQLGVRREPGVGVGVLGLQVGERARIVAVAQPEVVVAARVAVNAHVARLARRDWGCGGCESFHSGSEWWAATADSRSGAARRSALDPRHGDALRGAALTFAARARRMSGRSERVSAPSEPPASTLQRNPHVIHAWKIRLVRASLERHPESTRVLREAVRLERRDDAHVGHRSVRDDPQRRGPDRRLRAGAAQARRRNG